MTAAWLGTKFHMFSMLNLTQANTVQNEHILLFLESDRGKGIGERGKGKGEGVKGIGD
jgi:hypothetical protein